MQILATLPLIVTIFFLILGKSAIKSASSGVICALLIIMLSSYELSINQYSDIFQNCIILMSSIGLVITAGQFLNIVLKKSGTIEKLSQFIDEIEISNDKKALLVVLGIAPAIESLTGFGVSLFVTIPVLSSLHDSSKSTKLSILSMNIMPWGTLGLATVVGAQFSGLSVPSLGINSSLISFVIFPLVGVFSYIIIGKRSLTFLFQCLLVGFITSSFLVISNIFISVEIAGVCAGVLSTILSYVIFRSKSKIDFVRLYKITKPYLLLFVLVVFSKIAVYFFGSSLDIFEIKSKDMSFNPVNSPGIPLLVTALVCQRKIRYYFSPKLVSDKIKIPILGIFVFLVLSQIMLKSSMLNKISEIFVQVSDKFVLVISPMLGVLSGYITGSNLGGNVLMMQIQKKLTSDPDIINFIPAIQNSSAGHAVFASLPMIMLVISISNGIDIDIKENEVIRFTLKCLIVVTVLLIVSSYLSYLILTRLT